MAKYQKLEQIKAFMKKNGITYREMSNLLDVDNATLHYMLNSGGSYPVIAVLEKFELLKSNPDDYLWENN